MTREEAYNRIDAIIAKHEIDDEYVTITSFLDYDALRMARKLLEQEPYEDAISRQAVLDINESHHGQMPNHINHQIWQEIKDLPSVNPQEPKTGQWEWVQYDGNPKIGNWHCSECRSIVIECVSKENKGGIPLYKYCPQCGAKIE